MLGKEMEGRGSEGLAGGGGEIRQAEREETFDSARDGRGKKRLETQMTNEVMKIRSHAYFTACKRKTSQRRRTVRSHTSTGTCVKRHWKGQEAEVSESKVPVSVCSKNTIKWFQLFPHSCLHVFFISTLILFLNPLVILSRPPLP